MSVDTILHIFIEGHAKRSGEPGAGSKPTSVRRVVLFRNSDIQALEAKQWRRNKDLGLELSMPGLSHSSTGYQKTQYTGIASSRRV